MTSAEYAKRAQECVELADRMTGDARQKLLEISQAWLQLADDAIASERKLPLLGGQALTTGKLN